MLWVGLKGNHAVRLPMSDGACHSHGALDESCFCMRDIWSCFQSFFEIHQFFSLNNTVKIHRPDWIELGVRNLSHFVEPEADPQSAVGKGKKWFFILALHLSEVLGGPAQQSMKNQECEIFCTKSAERLQMKVLPTIWWPALGTVDFVPGVWSKTFNMPTCDETITKHALSNGTDFSGLPWSCQRKTKTEQENLQD